jgi:hypothetical protein
VATYDPWREWFLTCHPEAAYEMTEPPTNSPDALSPFSAVLAEIQALHDKKNQDYGRPRDPYANVRASEDFGIAPWVGALVRANDKMRRLQRAASGHTLMNEGVEDSLLDLATYAIIGLVLYRERENG